MHTYKNNTPSLISSRICHDLISPISAIIASLDMIEINTQQNNPEIELIAQSVKAANAKINLFRIAFGQSKGNTMSTNEIQNTLNAAYASRCKVYWDSSGIFLREYVQLGFLIALCGEHCLPRGGSIHIKTLTDMMLFEIEGQKIRLEEERWGYLQGTTTQWVADSANVQFEMAHNFMTQYGLEINIEKTDTKINITCTLPNT